MAKRNVDIDILKSVEEYIKEISKHYNIQEVYLFGSYAKGTNHEDSDIDIAIITDDLKHGDRIDEEIYLTKLRRNIDYRIEPHLIEIADYDNVETPFVQEVIDTGIKVA